MNGMNVSLRSGFADITPERPIPLAGYVDRPAPFDAVHQALEVNAIVLGRATECPLIIASFDLLYVGSIITHAVEEHLRSRHGIPAAHVLLAASHTHFAPATDPNKPMIGIADPAYGAFAAERTIELLDRLLAGPETHVRLTTSRGKACHAVNRRRPKDDGVEFAPHLRGRRDETIDVLHCNTETGPSALVWRYTCHPVARPQRSTLSPEYPGTVRAALRKQYGSQTAVLFLQGFCGDIRPRSLAVTPGWRGWIERLTNKVAFRSFSPDEWDRWADGLARCVVSATHGRQRALTSEMTAEMAVAPLSEFVADAPPGATLTVRRLSIGGLRLTALSAEPSLPLADVVGGDWVIGYAGDVFGYLTSTRQRAEGGYEAEGFLPLVGLHGPMTSDPEAALRQVLATIGKG